MFFVSVGVLIDCEDDPLRIFSLVDARGAFEGQFTWMAKQLKEEMRNEWEDF